MCTICTLPRSPESYQAGSSHTLELIIYIMGSELVRTLPSSLPRRVTISQKKIQPSTKIVAYFFAFPTQPSSVCTSTWAWTFWEQKSSGCLGSVLRACDHQYTVYIYIHDTVDACNLAVAFNLRILGRARGKQKHEFGATGPDLLTGTSSVAKWPSPSLAQRNGPCSEISFELGIARWR